MSDAVSDSLVDKIAMPRVSIGMPVYNGASVIRRAIDSLLTQSFVDFELIISDNASDDETQDICIEYASKDHRVTYLRNERNVGALANFHKVLLKASGEFFFWAAHDDWWDSRFVESAVTTLDKNPTASACMGVVHYLKSDGCEFMTHSPPYALDKRNAAERAYSYFRQGTTDNLIYAVHRTSILRAAPFELSTCPEKLIILHSILSGEIIDSREMEYYNVVSFKVPDEVAAALALNSYSPDDEVKVFRGVLRLLYEKLSLLAFLKVLPVYFIKNSWHKFFAKGLLRKFRLPLRPNYFFIFL